MYVKKTITLPKELERQVEEHLIGKHYSNLSEVIRDGLRRILREYGRKESIDEAAELYKEDRISIREAGDLVGLTLRETLEEFGKRGVHIRYGREELDEDTA
jgi:Arc/MetJ-type ribon-helix-helix transcriptional regulator